MKPIKKNIITTLAICLFLGSASSAATIQGQRIMKYAGADRVETSILTTKLYREKKKSLTLVNANSFADALSAYNLVSKDGGSLILVGKNSKIAKEIYRLNPSIIYLVGGEDTLNGKAVEDAYDSGVKVKRIAGSGRYDTNKKSLEESGFTKVGVADGRNFPDALSAGGLLKSKGYGLMLVNGSKPYNTGYSVEYTFGGRDSVKQDGGIRLAGDDRYKTSEVINKEIKNPKGLIMVAGDNFADALSSINVLQSYNSSAVALLNGKNISNYNKSLIADNKIGFKFIIGDRLKYIESNIQKIANGESVDTVNEGSTDENKPKDPTPNKPENVNVNNETGAIKTQEELDRYMINEFLKGMNEGTNYVKTSGAIKDVSEGVKRIIDGCGYNIVISPNKNGLNYSLRYNESINSIYYSVPEYDKELFIRNISLVNKYIKSSGADSKNSRKEKAYAFAVELKREIPYYDSGLQKFEYDSGTPYSILLMGKGSCSAYVYINNLAYLKMGIPAISIYGYKKNEYHVNTSFMDKNGYWEELNVSGVVDNERFKRISFERALDTIRSERVRLDKYDNIEQDNKNKSYVVLLKYFNNN